MRNKLTIKELSSATGKHERWLRKILPELQEAGLVERHGWMWVLDRAAVAYINRRPETRGRKKKEG